MVRFRLGSDLRHETLSHYLLLGTTLVLTAFGLVMVLSASLVESYSHTNSFFGPFIKQSVLAAIGVPAMFGLIYIRPRFIRRFAWPLFVLAAAVQCLTFVPGLKSTVGDNSGWIYVAGVSFQPAELMKVLLAVWLSFMIPRKERFLSSWRHVVFSILLWCGLLIGLVLLGGDLGTTMVLGAIVFGAMFFGGVPMRILITLGVIAVAVALVAVRMSGSRSERFLAFFTGSCDVNDLCWQTEHGIFALAAGGLFGVGLGQAHSKWAWLPEAENDFIFAIIGEETGLFGALAVIVLFLALILAMVRILLRQHSLANRVLVGSIATWLAFQTLVNLAVVLGLLPVLGVPLPFISQGGSALVMNLVAVGLVLGVSRDSQLDSSRVHGGRAPRVRESKR